MPSLPVNDSTREYFAPFLPGVGIGCPSRGVGEIQALIRLISKHALGLVFFTVSVYRVQSKQ